MTERISNQDLGKGYMDGLMKTEFYIKKSALEPKLLELIKYRVSQMNGCAYCLDMHHKEAIHMGETELRLHSLAAWKECPYYSKKERVALSFTEVITSDNPDVGEGLFQELSRFYSKTEIADLSLAVIQINSWNRINKIFRITPGNYKLGQFEN